MTQQPPQYPYSAAVVKGILLVSVWLTVIVAGLWATGQVINYVDQSSSCTVGIVGLQSSIVFQGNSASQDCDMFVQQYPQEYYYLTGSDSESTICEGDLPQRYYSYSPSSYYKYYIPPGLYDVHYVVKSSPEYNAIGYSICSALIGPSQ